MDLVNRTYPGMYYKLRPGDVVVERASAIDVYGLAARLFGQRHQHALLYTGSGWGVEAGPFGIRKVRVHPEVWNHRWIPLRPLCSDEIKAKACELAKADINKPYGVANLLAHALKLKLGWRLYTSETPEEDTLVCSGYICRWFRRAGEVVGIGYDLVPGVDDYYTSPDVIAFRGDVVPV